MIDLLKQKLSKYESNDEKYNFLREDLQLLILAILDQNNAFKNISFLGGTALRILYKIRRFSEDLDFSLISSENYSFDKLVEQLDRSLDKRNLRHSFKIKRSIGAVRSVFIRFKDLLYALGLSPLPDQNLAIKLEIDENPPPGFKTEFTSLQENQVIGINHFDLSSAFAGKIHAILARQYTKGRDYFDLLWFLGRNIEPNLEFLNNGLQQSYDKDFGLDMNGLEQMLIQRIKETNYSSVCKDLEPFIMDPESLKHYNEDLFISAIQRQFN